MRISNIFQKTLSAGRDDILFLAIALFFGIIFTFVTPPFRAPDESGHFARAYQLAANSWSAINDVSFTVPTTAEIADEFAYWGHIADERADQQTNQPYQLESIRKHLHGRASNGYGVISVAHPQELMFPLAYFPQSIAIKIGSYFGESFLFLLYTARLANFFFCLILTALAIRLMPYGKGLLAAVNLLPMAVFERSQISTDGLLMSACSLALAALLSLSEKNSEQRQINKFPMMILLSVSLIGIAFCKSIYLVIVIAWVFLSENKTKVGIYSLIIAAPACLLAVWWAHFLNLHDYRILNGPHAGLLDPTEKLALLRHAPLDVAMRIIRTLWRHIFDWFGQMIGTFCQMDVQLPLYIRFAGFIWLSSLLFLKWQHKKRLNNFQSTGIIAIFVGQVFLVLLTIFIIWADPKSPYIGGIQGRYFLPLLPCLLLGLSQMLHQRGIAFSKEKLMIMTYAPAAALLTISVSVIAIHEWAFS